MNPAESIPADLEPSQPWVTRSASQHVHPAAFAVEPDNAVDQGEEGVVGPHADVVAGVERGAHLTDENIAGPHRLTGELLHPPTLGIRITAVATGTLTFFMGHDDTFLSVDKFDSEQVDSEQVGSEQVGDSQQRADLCTGTGCDHRYSIDS
jgi:hypothetical protein